MSADDPQVELGYVKFANELDWALRQANLTHYENLVIGCIAHHTYARGKKTAAITTQQFCEYCKIPSKNIYKAIKRLKTRNMILTLRMESKTHTTYGINKRYKSWDLLSIQRVVLSNEIPFTLRLESSLPIIKKKRKKKYSSEPSDNSIPFQEIISYLNEQTGKNFSHKTKDYREKISGRWHDGYTLENFKTVIDNKVADWKGTEYAKYLQPSTLFRPSHFDQYLNQTPAKKKGGGWPSWV